MSTPLPMAPSALVELDDVRARVDRELADQVTRLRTTLTAIGDDALDLVHAVERMLSGGKRLRAAFCYWAFRAHGGQRGTAHERAALRVGAALELFQAAALFHDDVMDDSDTRRGQPAAHRAFAQHHAARGLQGSAEGYGASSAILLGDLALVASEEMFAAALDGLDPAGTAHTRAVFDHMRTEVTVGQYLDLLAQVQPWGRDPEADERRARDVIRAKSARYSVEHPLVLGATLAGATDDEVADLRAIGLPLGEAFQLRDDVLGVYGDPRTTGKPAGDDLREGKRTVLVARAMRRALDSGDERTAALLRDRLGVRDQSDASVHELATAIRQTGAVDEVEALIDELAGPAFARLHDRAWPQPAGEVLEALAHAAVDRRA